MSPTDNSLTDYEHLRHGKGVSDALFLSIGEGAIVTDERGNVARINQAALDILNCKLEDVMGKWYPAIVPAEYEDGTQIPNLERPITKVFLTGKVVRARIYYRRKDGSRVIVDLSVAPVMIDGTPSGAIEVFRDVTQEAALERAKDEFISLASHQLRTPATGVKQYAGMLLEGYAGELSVAQQAMVQSIYDSNERQITIINDLLKVAHIDAGQVKIEKHSTDIIQLIRDVIKEQEHKFKTRHQTITFSHRRARLDALIDPKNMRMVLENIVDNASKYTPEGKAIKVTVRHDEKRIEIAVRDQGVGIEPRDIPKIFQKFSRLNNPLSVMVGGTGLGLYWAKKIIQLHGGSITVSSQPNQGTVFTVLLPIRKMPTSQHKPVADTPPNVSPFNVSRS